jgi:hypothetical protein
MNTTSAFTGRSSVFVCFVWSGLHGSGGEPVEFVLACA